LLLKIKRADTVEEKQALEKDLVRLTKAEPVLPLCLALFFEDTTQGAIIHPVGLWLAKRLSVER